MTKLEPASGVAVRGWHHTSFTVTDMERALALYRDLLGLTVVVDQEVPAPFASRVTGVPGAALRIVFLQLESGGHLLELVQYRCRADANVDAGVDAEGAAAPAPGGAHVCFLVHDLAAEYARLRAHGVCFVSEPVPIAHGPNAGGRTVYLRDLDGGTVELLELPTRT